ncbi:Carboxylesterase [Xylariales sp. PMI_506]|nr:Carboxylesterase [Xylariales sp. PMI_506]
MRSLKALIPAALGLATASASQTVEISNGTLQGGKCNTTESNYFFAIPYAKPPIGDLRYAAPQPYDKKFNGTYDATTIANSCIQFSTVFAESNTLSEDCLYLDIWAPSWATAGSKLPVKVWLYGGVNVAGGISDPSYDGCFSTSESLVVSINYRLGPLGFLAVTDLGLSGNFGVMDQVLGLRWVQENIAAFGGDPTQVLLFGQSAGASDTFTIATMEEAPQLMKAAAMESGGGRELVTIKQAQTWQTTFVEALNCSLTDIDCVRAASTDAVVAASYAMPTYVPPGTYSPFNNLGARSQWGPVVDGDFIAVSPGTAGVKVPSIFGSNADEGSLFVVGAYGSKTTSLTQADYDVFLEYNFGPLASVVNETYSAKLFNGSYAAAMELIVTEATYKCPAYRGLLRAQELGVPAWAYEFAHAPSCAWYSAIPASSLSLFGAAHTAEIPFVWNTTSDLPLPSGGCTFTDAEQALAAAMSQAWISMAQTADPGLGSQWPQWSNETSVGVNINNTMVVGAVDYSHCIFWDEIYEESIKIVNNCYKFD